MKVQVDQLFAEESEESTWEGGTDARLRIARAICQGWGTVDDDESRCHER